MAAKTDRIEIFRQAVDLDVVEGIAPDRIWRWRYVRRNGSIIASSGEGYTKRVHAIRMAKHVTGYNDRTFMWPIEILGPSGQDWSNVN